MLLNKIADIREEVKKWKKAGLKVGLVPTSCAIRGGTDGANLTFMGLPCPNICTGGENFHSRFEFLSVQSLHKVVEIVERLIINATYAERN